MSLWTRLFTPSLDQLSDRDLELSWARLKGEILVADVQVDEKRYEALFEKLETLQTRIVNQYRYLVFEAEQKHADYIARSKLTMFHVHRDDNGRSERVVPRYDANVDLSPNEVLPWFALQFWTGGRSDLLGNLWPNVRFVTRVVDELVDGDRDNSGIGHLLKGLILKYGATLYAVPNFQEAREEFERAIRCGADDASRELVRIEAHESIVRSIAGPKMARSWTWGQER